MTRINPIWMQTTAGAPTYAARLDRMILFNTFTEGVLGGALVSQRAAGANMTCDISVLYAVIYGDDQANQGAYLINGDAVDTVTIGAAPGSNSRIDLVYLRVNDPNAGGPAGLNWVPGVVAGTPAASPSVPALPTSAIPIATVLVATGTVAITNAMITDARIAARVKGSAPFGSVYDFAGREADVPSDHLLSYGQAVSRATYFGVHALAKAAGYPWGSGDGTTTFNLPDYRGMTGVGLDNMGGSDRGKLSTANTLGLAIGEETHGLTQAETPLKSHTHSYTDPSHNHAITDLLHHHTVQNFLSSTVYAAGTNAGPTFSGTTNTSDVGTGLVATDFAGIGITINAFGDTSATAHNNVQPSVMVNKIIRAL